MISRHELEQVLDKVMEEESEKFFKTVPHAAHLTDESGALDEGYYLRHRVETVKRIRLTAKTDALALAKMIDEDYEAAREWSEYTAEELSHDRLYLADLRKHGYTDAQVNAAELFPATSAMLRYLETSIDRVGSIAAVSYSVFVEWNSDRYSRKAVAKAETHFSPEFVKGSKAHVGIDDDLDHYALMVNVAHRLLARHGDETVLVDLIRQIASHFRNYFTQLHESTVGMATAVSH
jgi:hypothetical protein